MTAATATLLVLAIVLGGGTRQGFLGDVIVQAFACILLAATLWRLWGLRRQLSFGVLGGSILGVAFLLCVVQLLPVFPGLGVKVISVPAIAGGSLALPESWWSRISLAPEATWAGLVSATVPVAVFAAVAQCDARGRLQLWCVMLCLGGIALTLGFAQIAGGPASDLRLFEITNDSEAVGFFANRNHFAAQLYTTLAFAGAWIVTAGRKLSRRRAFNTRTVVSMAGATGFLLLLTAGLAVARSRAGLLIAAGVVVGIAAIALRSPRAALQDTARRIGLRYVLVAIGFVVLLVLQIGLQRVLDRFQTDIADDLRVPLATATFKAAWWALPMGTGIGSFPRVYGAIEDPSNLLNAYVNHAHNDLAEFLLETGVLGASLLCLFLVWLGHRAAKAWSQAPASDNDLYVNVVRAATLVIGGLLMHALVDYGLRTTAISVIFAFACGLLTTVATPEVRDLNDRNRGNVGRHPSSRRPQRAPRPPPQSEPEEPNSDWIDGVSWPDAWKLADQRPPPRKEADRKSTREI